MKDNGFHYRGIVEGFFGPPWSARHRAALLEFGAARGMNCYLYAPKDDPYHRERWSEPYPAAEWRKLLRLIRLAEKYHITFVYGFHPGKGLRFGAREPIRLLLRKAERFYEAGVRTFAVLFDDIPSRLADRADRTEFKGSLARAEGKWLKKILAAQPGSWDVEWWLCPSYYTEDPLLARAFGRFEPHFLERLAEELPETVACFWTGPKVVPQEISLGDLRRVSRKMPRRLLLWDNYPVNDLAMSTEMHLGPLRGRDPRLPEAVYGYLNNPLLQESLSFIPLATCFDYAAHPHTYDAEASWERAVVERFGRRALKWWRALREFCEADTKATRQNRTVKLSQNRRDLLARAYRYAVKHAREPWFEELQPWIEKIQALLEQKVLRTTRR